MWKVTLTMCGGAERIQHQARQGQHQGPVLQKLRRPQEAQKRRHDVSDDHHIGHQHPEVVQDNGEINPDLGLSHIEAKQTTTTLQVASHETSRITSFRLSPPLFHHFPSSLSPEPPSGRRAPRPPPHNSSDGSPPWR